MIHSSYKDLLVPLIHFISAIRLHIFICNISKLPYIAFEHSYLTFGLYGLI